MELIYERLGLLGADLSDADFTLADLRGAVYNDKTIWPADFNPINHGAIPVQWEVRFIDEEVGEET